MLKVDEKKKSQNHSEKNLLKFYKQTCFQAFRQAKKKKRREKKRIHDSHRCLDLRRFVIASAIESSSSDSVVSSSSDTVT